MKSFKSFVRKICLEENGHVVMMAVFDTVDDTVLVKKTLISVRSQTTSTMAVAIPCAAYNMYHRRWWQAWRSCAMTHLAGECSSICSALATRSTSAPSLSRVSWSQATGISTRKK